LSDVPWPETLPLSRRAATDDDICAYLDIRNCYSLGPKTHFQRDETEVVPENTIRIWEVEKLVIALVPLE
jgi:hypothetical protein